MSRARIAVFFALLAVAGVVPAQGPGTAAADGGAAAASSDSAANVPDRTVPRRGDLKVGVVDFVRVIAAYPRAIAERKKLDDWRQQRRELIDAEERKAQEIKLKRDDLQQGTVERAYKDHELRIKLQDIDGLRQIFDVELRRKIDDFQAMVYDDLRRAVEIVARNRGADLVLRAHLDPEDGSNETKARVLESRLVWFASDQVDLTPDVIKLLQVPLPPEPAPAPAQDPPKESSGG